MASSLRSKVEEHLSCPVCLEQLKDPKVLPCLHSYCHDCIVKLVRKAKSNSIACPECRTTVKITDTQKLSSLPSNFFVNNLLATMALTDDNKIKEILCDNCESEDVAETHCKECRVFLCHFCSEFHRRSRTTKLHKLLSMHELQSSTGADSVAEKITCSKHKEEVIKLYCKTCQVTICRDCTIVDHREHDYKFVEDVALQEKQNLQKNLNEVKQRKVRVGQGIANLKKFDLNLTAKKEFTIAQIDKHFNELARAMESQKTRLVQRAESLTNSKQKQIHAQVEELELTLASCESSIDFTEGAFKNGNDVQILSMQKYIFESLKKLQTVKDCTQPCVSDDITFSIPMTVEETTQSYFNLFIVDDSVASPGHCQASFNQKVKKLDNQKVKKLDAGKKSAITVILNDKHNRRIKRGGQVIKAKFTGVDVSDVTVTDNKDGSHIVGFIPRSGGVLKFEVTVDEKQIPSCSLTSDVTWVISNVHGTGKISVDGLTMTPNSYSRGPSQFNQLADYQLGMRCVRDGEECYRVGRCYFESGVHSWKIEANDSSAGYYGGQNNGFEVGVVDCGGFDPNARSNIALDIAKCSKWVQNCNCPGQLEVMLDMGNKTLRFLLNPDYDSYNTVQLNPRPIHLTAQRVSPYFAIKSSSVSLVIVQYSREDQ